MTGRLCRPCRKQCRRVLCLYPSQPLRPDYNLHRKVSGERQEWRTTVSETRASFSNSILYEFHTRLGRGFGNRVSPLDPLQSFVCSLVFANVQNPEHMSGFHLVAKLDLCGKANSGVDHVVHSDAATACDGYGMSDFGSINARNISGAWRFQF